MFIQSLLTLAYVAAIVGAFAAIFYHSGCQALERHLATAASKIGKGGQDHEIWYRQRSLLGRRSKLTLGLAIGTFSVGMLSLVPMAIFVQDHFHFLVPVLFGFVFTANISIVHMRAIVHYSRR